MHEWIFLKLNTSKLPGGIPLDDVLNLKVWS